MTNGKDFAEWAADYGFTDEQTYVHQYALRVARDAWDKALSVCADGGKDSSDARDAERYRYLRNCGVICDFTRSGPWKFTDDVDAAIDKYLERKAAIAGDKK